MGTTGIYQIVAETPEGSDGLYMIQRKPPLSTLSRISFISRRNEHITYQCSTVNTNGQLHRLHVLR